MPGNSISVPTSSVSRILEPTRANATGSTLVNLHLQPVGNEAHHAGGFDPRNLFQLRFPLGQRHKENIAADVAAHDFHHLGAGNVLQAR